VKGVAVINVKFLNKLLKRKKTQLSQEDIKAITAILMAITSQK